MLKTTVKKLPNSEVEIEGELHEDAFETYFSVALKKLSAHIELNGFRKGKVPESVLLTQITEPQILGEMAELALSEHYPKILEAEKIDAISRPEITITKLARKNPLGFKIKTAIIPEVKLPKYKDLAKDVMSSLTAEEKNLVITDEDVENTIMDIRKSRAPKKHVQEGVVAEEAKENEESLPEFNDEFVQALGPFTDLADFRSKLKENIKIEKNNQQKEKTRLKIMERIIEKAEIEVPAVLIDMELDKILYRMESDITTMGLKFDDYLKHLNKTIEDLKQEFRTDAEKKAKLALILNEISKKENIVADEAQVAAEVSNIIERYKDADPERARIHAENVLINEKIFQFLETQK